MDLCIIMQNECIYSMNYSKSLVSRKLNELNCSNWKGSNILIYLKSNINKIWTLGFV